MHEWEEAKETEMAIIWVWLQNLLISHSSHRHCSFLAPGGDGSPGNTFSTQCLKQNKKKMTEQDMRRSEETCTLILPAFFLEAISLFLRAYRVNTERERESQNKYMALLKNREQAGGLQGLKSNTLKQILSAFVPVSFRFSMDKCLASVLL